LSPENPRDALIREAFRLHQRYQRELVERFSICPWARPARFEDHVRAHVVVDTTFDKGELRPLVDDWAGDETAVVAFIIVPRFDAGPQAFAKWTQEIGALREDVFLSAPFHPEPGDSIGTIQFFRQTPDPTVQLVRRTRLEEIRAQDPPHYADIFDLELTELESGKAPRTVAASVLAHNDRIVGREGRPALQSIIDDIRKDRDGVYARLLPML
jgi:hypothetical protein